MKLQEYIQGRTNPDLVISNRSAIFYTNTQEIRKNWLLGKISSKSYKAKLKAHISDYEVPSLTGNRKLSEKEIDNYVNEVFNFSNQNKSIEREKLLVKLLGRIRNFVKGSKKDGKQLDNLAIFGSKKNRDKIFNLLKKFRKGKISTSELVTALNKHVRPAQNELERNAFENFLNRKLSPEQFQEVVNANIAALYRPLPKQQLSNMSTSQVKRTPSSTTIKTAPTTPIERRSTTRHKL